MERRSLEATEYVMATRPSTECEAVQEYRKLMGCELIEALQDLREMGVIQMDKIVLVKSPPSHTSTTGPHVSIFDYRRS
jgi:hypothetical protein